MEDCQYFPKSKSKNSAYIIIYINKYFGTYINTNFGLHLSLVSPSSPFQFWLWFHPKFFPWILRFLKLPNSSFQDCDFWKQLFSNYFPIKKSIQRKESMIKVGMMVELLEEYGIVISRMREHLFLPRRLQFPLFFQSFRSSADIDSSSFLVYF